MMKKLILLFWVLTSLNLPAQLKYIRIADTANFFNEKNNSREYPKYHLRENRQGSLYLEDTLIFNNDLIPENYKGRALEVFQDNYLIITFFDENFRGVSNFASYLRIDVAIIDLKNASFLYKAKFDSVHIVNNKKVIENTKHLGEINYYAITSIDSENLILENNFGKKTKIPLDVIKNPLKEGER